MTLEEFVKKYVDCGIIYDEYHDSDFIKDLKKLIKSGKKEVSK